MIEWLGFAELLLAHCGWPSQAACSDPSIDPMPQWGKRRADLLPQHEAPVAVGAEADCACACTRRHCFDWTIRRATYLPTYLRNVLRWLHCAPFNVPKSRLSSVGCVLRAACGVLYSRCTAHLPGLSEISSSRLNTAPESNFNALMSSGK